MKRSFLQAKILTEIFNNNENARILDIGCFESWFPKKDNFHFISTDLGNLDGLFDLIILSHSILYIPNQLELMSSISRILKDDGILFIQIPDIHKNPYYSLMGDQSFIFTETSLKNVLGTFGYKVELVKNDYFPENYLLVQEKMN